MKRRVRAGVLSFSKEVLSLSKGVLSFSKNEKLI